MNRKLAPGIVSVRYELIHDVRVIPLDPSTRSGSSRATSRDNGREHLDSKIRLELGDARGHWEGNALVIETTNFKDRSTYRNANAATLRLIERFTPTSAGRIEWSVTIDDLSTWTRPWTFSMPLTKTDTEPVLEFACHEGNYAVRHILSGARAADAPTSR